MRWLISRYLSRYIGVQLGLLLICLMLIVGPANSTESRLEFWSGNVVFGQDFVNNGMSQDLFHQQTLAATDTEALSISLPADTGGGTTFSPSISQTSSGTTVATSTGFFEANYLGTPGLNFGAAPVGVGQSGVSSPVSTAKFSSKAVFYPEMVVQGNLLNESQRAKLNVTRMSLPPGKANGASGTLQKLAAMEAKNDAEGFDARDANLPVILSGMTIDSDAEPDQINNTSILERLWRNTHQGAILDYAYEGDTAWPTWIAPVKNIYALIDCGDQTETIDKALQMTQSGRCLTTAFWYL